LEQIEQAIWRGRKPVTFDEVEGPAERWRRETADQ